MSISTKLYDRVRNNTWIAADINALICDNKTKATPLQIAVYLNDRLLVTRLLDLGADPEIVDENGNTALSLALIEKHWEIVKLLIQWGTSLNQRVPFLHHCVMHGKVELLKMGLRIGLDANSVNENGDTPLELALNGNAWRMSKILIQGGATLNLKFSFLHHCILKNQPELLELGLKHGLSVDTLDSNGKSVLHALARTDSESMLKILIQAGAKLESRDRRGTTPILSLLLYGPEISIIRKWIDAGANIHAVSFRGENAYHWIQQWHQSDPNTIQLLLEYLLRRGVNPSIRNSIGWSGLDWLTKLSLPSSVCAACLDSSSEFHKSMPSGKILRIRHSIYFRRTLTQQCFDSLDMSAAARLPKIRN